ncbi:hypothetical protein Xcel_1397 [Xylanimonas cellulosilytica DSM 15894]|uniref:Uncharacterized protein n=1 Tax=Xylanimonas cellulosilytica (strain DSM 15894 / JCM 12276 / CECT 5975 / KCTC 9989 / LMG 20990 / NBRC 107835 / XIL07) TaxID=446471 RepID=D1BRH3_XYLCX|nr:hypothetical protein [Xylanimonas cellulosilytica]ACZ30428.1 hypothetical protein Xcel_1397 [Xylanimonas cellulosilytica DSM 15894]
MTGLVMVGGGGAACEGDACLLPGTGASESASDAVDPAREALPVAPPVPPGSGPSGDGVRRGQP